jgi:hypothetical protein
MSDHRSPNHAAQFVTDGHADVVAADSSPRAALRRLGGLAHQLQAATRAADHFIACNRDDDRNTGSWLIACAVELAADLATELDDLGRTLRGAPADEAQAQQVQKLRKRAHQLHAAARAADHYLDQDHHTDRDTGSWLIACAMGLAGKLAGELDDGITPLGVPAAHGVIDHHDSAMLRRVVAA